MSRSRGNHRDRRERGLRRPILAGLFRVGDSRLASFGQIVAGTCDYLKEAWPEELAALRWRIIDAPAINQNTDEVARWSVNKQAFEITIYRLPIERMGHSRRPDALDERMHIEQYVFTAVGELIGKDPWELIPERYRNDE
jgi:hypothetical protein